MMREGGAGMSGKEMETIVEKVKKLLRLSRGTNSEAESLNALAKAKEMCALYGLRFESVDAEAPRIKEEKVLDGKRNSASKRWVFGILDAHFGIMVCEGAMGGVYFVGPEENIEIGKFILEYLLASEKRAWSSFVDVFCAESERRMGTEGLKGDIRKSMRKYKKDFTAGFYYKVYERLAQQPLRNDKVKEAVKRHVREKYGDLPHSKPRAQEGEDKSGIVTRAGVKAGGEVNLSRPVEGTVMETARIGERGDGFLALPH